MTTLTEETATLLAEAERAALLRTHRRQPDVVALNVEQVRDQLDRWGWLFLLFGLSFTVVNVQSFVAGDASIASLRWWTAWLVEPMVMGLMLVLLRGEQVANRHKQVSGSWVRTTRWIALGITYVMNTALAWSQHDLKQIFVHSTPVVLVFLAAEALVLQRQILTSVVDGLGGKGSRAPKPAQQAKKTPESAPAVVEAPITCVTRPDELGASRTNKERAYQAFRELATEALAQGGSVDDIKPTPVDRRADVPAGTSKAGGPRRMTEFRTRFLNEREEGGHDLNDGRDATSDTSTANAH